MAGPIEQDNYLEFLRKKVQLAEPLGFDIDDSEVNPLLLDHQKAMVKWLVRGGRRACFAAFGLGKSVIQLEVARITREKAGGMGMIVIPLGVRQEFMRDAHMLATGDHPNITDEQRAELKRWQGAGSGRIPQPKFIRRIEEACDPTGIYLTNYETIRDGKLDPRLFDEMANFASWRQSLPSPDQAATSSAIAPGQSFSALALSLTTSFRLFIESNASCSRSNAGST